MQLPALRSVIVTGDLDPLVALQITGEAADPAAAPPPASTPAGPATGSGDAARAEPERRTKQRIRSNQKDAFDLGE